MFKLPDKIPNRRDSPQEWADYAEFAALKNGEISLLSLFKPSLIIDDEIVVNGIEDEADGYINKIDSVISEIRNRINFTGSKYPYFIKNYDYTIAYKTTGEIHDIIYNFLLFCTRLNMRESKIQGGVDGTKLFERLSAEIARNYFGYNSEAEILGTSKTEIVGFRNKLKEITKKIGEGGTIHENNGYRPQDDNVDVIVWKGFSDKKTSQVIGFGQCKTGTSWQNNISELDTKAFCNTWFSIQPVIEPIRMFFCAQYFPSEIWQPRAYNAGLVFDRFRILDYLPDTIDYLLLDEISKWYDAALIFSKNNT